MFRVLMLLPLIILILPGLSLKMKNEDYLSRETCLNVKGLAAIMVVIGHMFEEPSTRFPPTVICQFGTMAVGLFFFFSGYGYADKELTVSYVKRKIINLWLPVLLLVPAYYICYNYVTPIGNGRYYGIKLLTSFLNGDPIINVSWYTVAVTYLLITLALAKYVSAKKEGFQAAMFWCVLILAFQLYLTKVFISGSGRHWLYTLHLFFVGVIWKRNELKLKKLLDRYVAALFAAAVVLIAISFVISPLSEFAGFIYVPIRVTGFVIFALSFLSCFKIGNPMMEFIGKNSVGLYLSHFIIIYQLNRYISNSYVFIIASFALSLPIGVLYNMLVSKVNSAVVGKLASVK